MLHPAGLLFYDVKDERKQRNGFKASPHQHLKSIIFTIKGCFVTAAGPVQLLFWIQTILYAILYASFGSQVSTAHLSPPSVVWPTGRNRGAVHHLPAFD